MAKILIIEDNQDIAAIYVQRLQFEKHTAAAVGNGKEGLEKSLAWKPDCIVLDIVLPVLSGLDVLKHLKKNKTTQSIPVIAISAFGSEENAKMALALGAVVFLEKEHVDPSDIAKVVRKYLSAK